MQDKGYTSVVDALQNTQITFTYNGFNSPNIDMRGQGAASPRAVKILQNGVTLNLIDSPFAYNRTPIDTIDVNNIEQIEIIPGGGAVLYGNGTRGGVVNFITKRASQTPYFNAIIGTGFNGLKSANDYYGLSPYVSVNGGFKAGQNLFITASAGYYDKHGFREGEFNRGYNLASNITYDLSEKQSLSLNFNFYQDWFRLANGLTADELKANRRQYKQGDSQNNIMKIATLISLNYNYKILENLVFDATAYYTYDNNTLVGTQGHFFDNKAGLNTKAKWDYNFFKGQLIGGYEFMWANGSRRSYQNTSAIPLIIDITNNPTKFSNALFALNRNTWTSWLDTSFGLRIENTIYQLYRRSYQKLLPVAQPNGPVTTIQNPTSNYTNFAIEIMPSFNYSDTGNAYIKYERGYISPSPSELTNGVGSSTNRVYSDSGVKPETYDTFEIGAKDYLLDSIFLSGAVYYTQTYDEIFITGGFMSANGWRYSNYAMTGRLGFEINAKEDFFSWLHLNQSFSYVYSQIQRGENAGNEIPFVPNYKVFLGFSFDIFDFGNQKLNLFVNTIFYGSQTMPLTNAQGTTYQRQNGYNLTDLGLVYNISNFTLSGGIRNLFDTEYNLLTEIQGIIGRGGTITGYTDQLYYPAPGRTYYLELRYKM
ncbi:TonB-dependent receptor [Helicobacter saguini]|uniref:TonB-dependent receptor n=1 Tax=Helicobacter saguini TaxID=1548018 RepID=UPI00301DFE21